MAYTDSLVGYAATTLSDPTTADSYVGFVVGSLTEPAEANDSPVGFVVAELLPPHHPAGVRVAGEFTPTRLLLRVGGSWS